MPRHWRCLAMPAMAETLIRNAEVVVTMDDARRELAAADLRLRDGVIAEIGSGLIPGDAEIIEARGCIVTPGLINTHHHLFQSLTRAVPGGQDALLFGWLQTLYPIWERFGPEEIRVSAALGLAELALSGCSLTADHLYLFPNGAQLDDSIDGARQVGIRLLATRGGAQALGRSADLGSLEIGKRADIAIWDVSGLEAAGGWDSVAALLLCGPVQVRDLIVEGRRVVSGGELVTADLAALLAEARRLTRRLMER